MKARITTVLSLTGVLVAGSAAALVNTQVLQNTTTRSATASEITVEDEQPESVSTVATTPSTAAGSLPNKLENLVPVAVTAARTPVAAQQSYAIGEAGTVVLDTANGGLAVVGITPNDGWGVVEHQNTDPLSIKVKFQSASTLVEFRANVLYGIVAWETESHSITQPTTAEAGTSPSSGLPGTTIGVTSARPPTSNTVDDGDSSDTDDHKSDDGHKSDDDSKSDDGHHGGSDDDD